MNSGALERFANSKFMTKLQEFSVKLSTSPAFSTLSNGMGATMGLVMIGAVVQIICAIGGFFGWKAGDTVYDSIYLVYNMTMGILAFFLAFSLAYNYAKKLKVNPLQSGFTSMVCFLLLCAPVQTVALADGTTKQVLDFAGLGSSSIFVAIIVGMFSVRITKFAVDHNWMLRLPDSVPEGVLNGFNSIIPAGINIILWYGLSLLIESFTGTTLANLIIYVLSIPINYLVSPVGMVIVLLLAQLFWFFGIHGTTVIYSVLMIPMLEVYASNAELAAAGLPLEFSFIFLMGANGIMGGAGNTLPVCIMGYKSKSEQIRAVSRASLVPGLFGINEPMVFGFPIMYNPILLIPFVLCPIVVMGLMGIAYYFGLMAYPSVLVIACMPLIFQNYITTLDWKNCVFAVLMFPVCWLIWYPFFKLYEKQCIANEQAAAEADAE